MIREVKADVRHGEDLSPSSTRDMEDRRDRREHHPPCSRHATGHQAGPSHAPNLLRNYEIWTRVASNFLIKESNERLGEEGEAFGAISVRP